MSNLFKSFDSFSYIFGKKYGRTKLTSVSPGKTFEGFVLGAFAASVVSFLLFKIFKTPYGLNYDKALLFTIAFIFCIQYADILESYIKRICEVKDSGNSLGGHGGFMDRFDGIYGGAILLYLVAFFSFGKVFLSNQCSNF
jgi:phosphatidate cytidylyltransferase